jgi:DNA-binding response OmpR family regulator
MQTVNMVQVMPFETLIISTDSEAMKVLKPELTKLGTKLHYSGGAQARDLLKRKKFDAIIVDCDEGGCLFLQQLTDNASNKAAVKFAMAKGKADAKSAFDLGANFILNKPLSKSSVSKLLKSLSALVEAERRQHFRHSVEISAELAVDGQRPSKVLIIDLSEGGVRLSLSHGVAASQPIKISFRLPKSKHQVEAGGQIAWTTEDGKTAGVRFSDLPKATLAELQNWLREHFAS